jgi:aldehyde:ferredoxin oxidoreductase
MNEVPLIAIRLCDRYGLDTAVMQPMIDWLTTCFEQGVLQEAETGLPLSKIGSAEFIEALVQKIAFREGFGDLLAQGMIKTAKSIGKEAQELLAYRVMTQANELKDYDPRLLLTNALLYATEPRRPIQQLHEAGHALIKWLEWHKREKGAYLSSEILRIIAEKFWGSDAAADFSTYEGKALAAKTIQDKAYAKESLILCDIFWPIKWVKYSEDHIGDPTLESQVFSAVTGVEADEDDLNRMGERIFNLQRAVLLKQGWGGREGDNLLDHLHDQPLKSVFFDPECIVPGPNGKPVSRHGEVVDRENFEKMKSEYYALRGWNVESGYPTRKKLKELELDDIADELDERGLIG